MYMEKSKKKEGLSRLFEIAGQKKGLLILAGVLSAGSAACMLVPYWAVYEILKELWSRETDPSSPYLTYQDFLDACELTEEDLNLA